MKHRKNAHLTSEKKMKCAFSHFGMWEWDRWRFIFWTITDSLNSTRAQNLKPLPFAGNGEPEKSCKADFCLEEHCLPEDWVLCFLTRKQSLLNISYWENGDGERRLWNVYIWVTVYGCFDVSFLMLVLVWRHVCRKQTGVNLSLGVTEEGSLHPDAEILPFQFPSGLSSLGDLWVLQ